MTIIFDSCFLYWQFHSVMKVHCRMAVFTFDGLNLTSLSILLCLAFNWQGHFGIVKQTAIQGSKESNITRVTATVRSARDLEVGTSVYQVHMATVCGLSLYFKLTTAVPVTSTEITEIEHSRRSQENKQEIRNVTMFGSCPSSSPSTAHPLFVYSTHSNRNVQYTSTHKTLDFRFLLLAEHFQPRQETRRRHHVIG